VIGAEYMYSLCGVPAPVFLVLVFVIFLCLSGGPFG